MNVEASSTSLALRTLAAPVAWGTTYVVITETLPGGRPLLVAAARVLPAGFALLVLARLRVGVLWRPRGAEWRMHALLAAANFGVFFPLLAAAVYRLPGGVAAAVGGLQPILVLGITRLFDGRRPRGSELAVSMIAALGVCLVVLRPDAHLDGLGLLSAIAANVSFSIGVVLAKRSPAGDRVAATGWQLAMSGVLLVPLALVVEGPPPSLSGENLAGFAYLSLVATGAAFLVWFEGVRRLPVVAPPLLGLAAPVTGVVLGYLLLDQTLAGTQLVGFVVTLGAITCGVLRDASANDDGGKCRRPQVTAGRQTPLSRCATGPERCPSRA